MYPSSVVLKGVGLLLLNHNLIRYFTIPLSFLIVLTFAVSSRAERPETMGFAPAFPKKLPAFETDNRAPFMTDWRDLSFVLHLDKKGRVEDATLTEPGDSSIYTFLEDYFDELRFEPARLDGEKVASLLPVVCRLDPRQPIPQMSFPIDPDRSVANGAEYNRALRLNEIILPAVIKFPSYSADLVSAAKSDACPFVLLQLDLNEGGQVIARKKLLSNYDSYDDQVLSAVLYAEFTPAMVRGRAVVATAWLLVSFYPFVTYPTAIYESSDTAAKSVWDRRRLSILADTTGLMTAPVPRQYPADTISLGSKFTYHRDNLQVSLRIGRDGRASITKAGKTSPEIHKAAIQAVRNMQFYPAVDFRGEPQFFTGAAAIEFTGSRTVRIHYHWLR